MNGLKIVLRVEDTHCVATGLLSQADIDKALLGVPVTVRLDPSESALGMGARQSTFIAIDISESDG